MLVHHEGDRDPGGPHLSGQGDGLVERGPRPGAGGDLLEEDPRDARVLEQVELGVQALADGGGAGIPDPRVRGRLDGGRRAGACALGSELFGEWQQPVHGLFEEGAEVFQV